MNSEADFAKDARLTLKAALGGLQFDEVLFFEHAPGEEPGSNLSCVRFVMDKLGNAGSWPQRWQADLPGTAPWIQSDEPWVDDLETIVDNFIPGTTLRVGELVGITQLRQRTVRSLLGAALFEDDKILVSIILGSKTVGAYREEQRDVVRKPGIAAALQHMLDRLQQRRVDLVRTMQRLFQPELSPQEIAGRLVETLATATGWDFVGIYRVEDKFTMVAACDRTPGQVLQIDPAYRQPLHMGMLGHTRRLRKCIWADDVTTTPPPYDFTKIDGFAAMSALSYPIIISGNVEWILDCSSEATGAFNGPDREMLDELIRGLQSTLNLWFETRLSSAILDSLSEAVVVTDRDGKIQRINAAACVLFGMSSKEQLGCLQDLVPLGEVETQRKLSPSRPLSNDDVTLLTATGQSRKLIATARLSSDAFGRYVYKFTSKGEREWLAAIDTAQAAVQGKLGQARGMLMMANALITRLRVELKAKNDIDRADAELGRIAEAIDGADLTYDRLIGSLGARPGIAGDSLVLGSLLDLAIGALRKVSLPKEVAGVSLNDGAASAQGVIDTLNAVALQLVAASRNRTTTPAKSAARPEGAQP